MVRISLTALALLLFIHYFMAAKIVHNNIHTHTRIHKNVAAATTTSITSLTNEHRPQQPKQTTSLHFLQ